MAQRVQTVLIDDVDGGVATEMVTFGLDGVRYEIDLSDDNARRLRASLQEWTEHGRRDGGRRRGHPRTARTTSAVSTRRARDLGDIRAWARQHGYTVSDRGRVASHIQDAYDKAHA